MPPRSTKHLSFIRLRFVCEAAHHLVTKRQKLSAMYPWQLTLRTTSNKLNPINVGLGWHGFQRQQKHIFYKRVTMGSLSLSINGIDYFRGLNWSAFLYHEATKTAGLWGIQNKESSDQSCCVSVDTDPPKKVPPCFWTEYDLSWR